MKEKIRIITLGDIFENIETEEKAFKFKDYVKELQEEVDRLNNIINDLEKYIGTEWYCFDNESIEHHVAWHILMKLKELKKGNK